MGKRYRKPKLTAAQREGQERVPLPDGRWYWVSWREDGTPIDDPNDPECELWEVGPDGVDTTWVGQATLAEWLSISPRWLQKLEARGMPARGFRETCKYPIPHALVWWLEYQRQLNEGGRAARITMEQAWAEHRRRCALEVAEIDYKMATDPAYRAQMEALEAEDVA
jgi:hypothetical protein